MSAYVSSFIGRGWVLSRYDVAPFLDEEDTEFDSNERNWWDEVSHSEFYRSIDSYNDDEFFFGVKISDTVEPGEVVPFTISDMADDFFNNIAKCEKEFFKLFASCEKINTYLISTRW